MADIPPWLVAPNYANTYLQAFGQGASTGSAVAARQLQAAQMAQQQQIEQARAQAQQQYQMLQLATRLQQEREQQAYRDRMAKVAEQNAATSEMNAQTSLKRLPDPVGTAPEVVKTEAGWVIKTPSGWRFRTGSDDGEDGGFRTFFDPASQKYFYSRGGQSYPLSTAPPGSYLPMEKEQIDRAKERRKDAVKIVEQTQRMALARPDTDFFKQYSAATNEIAQVDALLNAIDQNVVLRARNQGYDIVAPYTPMPGPNQSTNAVPGYVLPGQPVNTPLPLPNDRTRIVMGQIYIHPSTGEKVIGGPGGKIYPYRGKE